MKSSLSPLNAPLPKLIAKGELSDQDVVKLLRKRLAMTDKRVTRVFTVKDGKKIKKPREEHAEEPSRTEAVCSVLIVSFFIMIMCVCHDVCACACVRMLNVRMNCYLTEISFIFLLMKDWINQC